MKGGLPHIAKLVDGGNILRGKHLSIGIFQIKATLTKILNVK